MILVVIWIGIFSFFAVRNEPDKKLADIFSALIITSISILVLLCVLDIVR
jgi:hypothetical protein